MKKDIHRVGQGRVKSGSNAEDKLFSDARATIIEWVWTILTL